MGKKRKQKQPPLTELEKALRRYEGQVRRWEQETYNNKERARILNHLGRSRILRDALKAAVG